MKVKKWMLVVTVVAVVGIGGWFGYQRLIMKEETRVKIGFVGPLSGDASGYGYSVQKALELAKRELRSTNIEIIPMDSRCEADKSKAAVESLIVQGVVAIVGDICSSATTEIVPLVEDAKIPLISPASTSPALRGISPYFFRTIPSDDLQGKFAAELLRERGYKKLMVFYTDEPYGKGFFQVLKTDFGKTGTVEGISMKSGQLVFVTAITQLKQVKPDAIYVVSNSPTVSAALIKQIREAGITTQLFGAEGLRDKAVLANAGNEAIEGLLVSSVKEGTKAFISLYKAEYEILPATYAAQGYDAFKLLYLALQEQQKTSKPLHEIIPSITFEGMSGTIAFDNKHEVSGDYSLWVVKNGEFVLAQ
jgi:branched-chain amino acid transport system substrate-binding protein